MADQTLSESQLMIDAHGDALYRYALLRVRNPHVAEDLVQETFLAALQGTYRESGEAAERRWMMGIMKHKLVDYYRRTAREPIMDNERGQGAPADDAFDADGHWKSGAGAAAAWPDGPDGFVERRQFWDSLARCLERLPARAAEVFLLREMDELRTETICELMHLTPTNLGVILHRARRQLRDCLSSRYFGRSEEGTSS